MAVFYKSKKNILRKINKSYNFVIKDIKSTKKGTDNSNFFIKTTKGKEYILTIFENIEYKYLLRCLYFMSLLNKNGVKTPNQIPNKIGKKVLYIKKKPFFIFNKIVGKNLIVVKNKHLFLIGILLAKIHLITIKNINFFIENRNDFYIIERKFNFVKNKLSEEYRFLIENEINFHKNNKLKITKILCHGDLFRDNVFFNLKEKCINGVIDFYFSGYDYLISDISIIINDWCIRDNKIDKFKVLKLIRSYLKINDLKNDNILNLNKNLRYTALRFLITRIYDIKVKKKIKEYKEKKISTFKKILFKHIKNELFYKKRYQK